VHYQDLETIISTTNRLPFDNNDLMNLKEYMKMSRGKGYDISLDPSLNGDTEAFQEALSQGFIILKSDMLDTCFLFLKVNGGTGFFGGQKKKIMSFVGSPSDFTFTPGHVFNKFIIALTAINNIYRG
jgi:hypothetical protein